MRSLYMCSGIALACFLAATALGAPVIVVDDGPSTGATIPTTGSWNYRPETGSGNKPNSWNQTGSRFAYAGGDDETATYVPGIPVNGLWEVSMWWPTFQWTNNALVQVNHTYGTTDLRVNQSTNSGKWNRLGRYPLYADSSVVISSAGANPGSNNVGPVADAVQFEYLGARITPSQAFASSSNTTNTLRRPIHVIDGSGMSDADGDGIFDTHQANDWGDDINWMSNGGDRGGWFVIDLGDQYDLYRAEVFNFNALAGRTIRGVGQADVYISTVLNPDIGSPDFADTSVWQLVQADVAFSPASGSNSYNTPDILSFDGERARWFALDIDTNLGDGSFAGLSEIQFFGIQAVPEPTTLALFGFALPCLGLIVARRSRRR